MAIAIELFRPNYNEEEIEEVKKVLKTPWIGMGPKTAEFEKKFAKCVGTKYAVAVNSCTAALQLAVNVLDLPKDTTFVVPSISFISTAFAPLYEGYNVVFADVEEDDLMISDRTLTKTITDWNLDTNKLAVIPVHLYGNMSDLVLNDSENITIPVIEDCAHACGSSFGSPYTGKRMAGNFGAMGCFSFHAVKNLACGDGGMVTTNDERLYKKLKERRWFGISKSTFERAKDDNLKIHYGWEYDIADRGYKMHMNDITAALGLAQLNKLDEGNKKRREIAETYTQELSTEEWIRTPTTTPNVVSSQHIYAIRTEHRDKLNLFLKDKGIATGVHYKPMYHYSFFKDVRTKYEELCPTTEQEWVKLLSLPCYPTLTELEQEYIISKIKEFGRLL